MGNRIKTRLRAGDMQVGAWLGLGTPVTAEIAGCAGYDWCLIDAEHGANGIAEVRDQLIALAAAGCPPAVRVAANEAWMIKQALDVGAGTLVVPMISSAAEARSAVEAALYPPGGRRGLAASLASER